MATYIAKEGASGELSTDPIWNQLVPGTNTSSLVGTSSVVTATATGATSTYMTVASTQTVAAVGLEVMSLNAPAGVSLFVTLRNVTDAVDVATVTVDGSIFSDGGNGFYFINFDSPASLVSGKSYNILIRASVTSRIFLRRVSAAAGWCRILVDNTAVTKAAGSGHTFYAAGRFSSSGFTTASISMTSSFGCAGISIGDKCTFTCTTNDLVLTCTESIIVYGGGSMLFGSSSSRIRGVILFQNLVLSYNQLDVLSYGTLEIWGEIPSYPLSIPVSSDALATATVVNTTGASGWTLNQSVLIPGNDAAAGGPTVRSVSSSNSTSVTFSAQIGSAIRLRNVGTVSPIVDVPKLELLYRPFRVVNSGSGSWWGTWAGQCYVKLSYTEFVGLGSTTANKVAIYVEPTDLGYVTADHCTFLPYSSAGSTYILRTTSNRLTQNLTLDACVFGLSGSSTCVAISLRGGGTTASNVIKNCVFGSISTSTLATGISFGDSSEFDGTLEVQNCKFYGFARGLYLNAAITTASLTVEDCEFYNCTSAFSINNGGNTQASLPTQFAMFKRLKALNLASGTSLAILFNATNMVYPLQFEDCVFVGHTRALSLTGGYSDRTIFKNCVIESAVISMPSAILLGTMSCGDVFLEDCTVAIGTSPLLAYARAAGQYNQNGGMKIHMHGGSYSSTVANSHSTAVSSAMGKFEFSLEDVDFNGSIEKMIVHKQGGILRTSTDVASGSGYSYRLEPDSSNTFFSPLSLTVALPTLSNNGNLTFKAKSIVAFSARVSLKKRDLVYWSGNVSVGTSWADAGPVSLAPLPSNMTEYPEVEIAFLVPGGYLMIDEIALAP